MIVLKYQDAKPRGEHWQKCRIPRARKYRVDFIQDTFIYHFFRYTIASFKCKFVNYV